MQADKECLLVCGHPRQVCIAAAAREGTQLLRTFLLLARSSDTLCRLKKFAGDCFHIAVETALRPFKVLPHRCGTARII